MLDDENVNSRFRTRATVTAFSIDFQGSSTMFSSECVSFASLTRNNIGTVRKLNFILFPINYAPKFYDGILQPEVEDFCKLGLSLSDSMSTALLTRCAVYYQDIPVGTICCRLESHEKQAKLYIMTMGVLAVSATRHRLAKPCIFTSNLRLTAQEE